MHGRNRSCNGMSAMMQGRCSGISFCWSFQARHGLTRNECVLLITTKSSQIWAQGTTFHPSIPTPGPAVLRGAQHPGCRQTTRALAPSDEDSELMGTNGRHAEGQAGEAGIYVPRGPLLNMNILVIVHFMAQSFAASFSNPDGLNWHFHYMCLH